MNLLCFFGIHDWETRGKMITGRPDLIFDVWQCRRCGRWADDRRGPPLPRPRPLPREVIRKGGMAEKPAGLPAKDPNTAQSGAEWQCRHGEPLVWCNICQLGGDIAHARRRRLARRGRR